MVATIHRGAPGSVYVLAEMVQGRPTSPVKQNISRVICEEMYDAGALGAWEPRIRDLIKRERREMDMTRRGADRVRAGWDDFFQSWVWDFNENTQVPKDNIRIGSTRTIAMISILRSGINGTTANEVRRKYGLTIEGIGRSLSILHKAGVIERLKEKR